MPVRHALARLAGERGEEAGRSVALGLEEAVEEAERAAIAAALQQANQHRERAANLLGVSVRTLHYKMNRYSLQ